MNANVPGAIARKAAYSADLSPECLRQNTATLCPEESRQIAAPASAATAPLEKPALSRREFASSLRQKFGELLVQGLRSLESVQRDIKEKL